MQKNYLNVRYEKGAIVSVWLKDKKGDFICFNCGNKLEKIYFHAHCKNCEIK